MCGVFGVYGHPEAANLTYLGLHALQHRGQESAGIVTSDGERLSAHRGMGHVIDVFPQEQIDKLKGPHSIGHVRYSTAGGSYLKNAQPIAVDYSRGSIAVAHNGNLTNSDSLREKLEARGSIFQSSSDTETIVHLVAISTQRSIEDRVADALSQVQGAYSLLCLTEKELIAVRDPMGIRPLCIGQMPNSDAYVVSSEPTSFDLIGAKYVRSMEPGEMVVFDKKGPRSTRPFHATPRKMCIFEYVYFARPDSVLDGVSVYEARKNLGRALADEQPVDADVVIPVPDSGLPATIGYSERSKIPFEMGLVRSHYVGRTFIEPQQSIRHFGVRLKLNPVGDALKGKRVVVVDDSIVRGTTSRKIVKMLRDAGAKEIHMRISSPPTKWPCYYGIDTPTRGELIASSHDVQEINQYITSDTLAYLSLDKMVEAVMKLSPAAKPNGKSLPVVNTRAADSPFCHACWSGDYPIQFTQHPRVRQMRLLDL
ncbi:MAG TPA: amidophosphoribosyltransferase [Polyangiaceae bacterium]|nr:amidophosphoribosyltransferase [Polyangiaceae bacterium]